MINSEKHSALHKWDPALDPETERGHYHKSWRHPNKVCGLVNSIVTRLLS